MPLDALLTVPHGARGNDVLGPLVGNALHRFLQQSGRTSRLLISRADRLEVADMNRAEGRGSQFRSRIAETIETERPRFLIDVHSFPDYYEPWTGSDIVLLETPGLTDRTFLETYVSALGTVAGKLGLSVGPDQDFFAAIRPAQCQDDVLIHARELGHPASSLMLAEHNEAGDPLLYGAIHAGALEYWLTALREEEDQAPEPRGTPEERERLVEAGYMEARVPFLCGNCTYNGGGVLDGRFIDPIDCTHKAVRQHVERRQACCNHFDPGPRDLLRGAAG